MILSIIIPVYNEEKFIEETVKYEIDDLADKGIKIIALEKLEKIIGKCDF